MDIPAEYRIGHKLYQDWIQKKYPKAAEFLWEKTGCKITVTPAEYFIRKFPEFVELSINKVLQAAGIQRVSKKGMNPVDYWIKTNRDLQTYMKQYVKQGIASIQGKVSPSLIEDMKLLFLKGNFSEKAMVMTVLAAVKQYFRGTDI